MTTRRNDTRRIPWTRLLFTLTALVCASGAGTMARQAMVLGPRVGDIIAFDPAHEGYAKGDARVAAGRAGGGRCSLDVGTLRRLGGSLVLEQLVSEPTRIFRAHWAGVRTSEDGADCGADADVLLPVEDVRTLASAAGGFGAAGTLLR